VAAHDHAVVHASHASDRVILITGANGMVGRQALEEYADGKKASHILATDITPNFFVPASSPGLTYEFICGNLLDTRHLARIRDSLLRRPEPVVVADDIAALFRYDAKWNDLYECNVVAQKNLVETTLLPLQEKGKSVRTEFWSAIAEYGNFDNPKYPLPAGEDYPLDPQDDYSKTKQIAEDLLLHYNREHGLWVTIMRCGSIYGEWSRYGMANAIVLQLLGMLEPLVMGTKQNRYGKNRVPLIYARDTVRVADFLSTRESANGRIFNVRDNSEYTLETIAAAQAEECDQKIFKHFRMRTEDFQEYIVAKVNAMSKESGLSPVVDTGLTSKMHLDVFVSIDALKRECRDAGVNYESLLLYPDSIRGLKHIIHWFKTTGLKEGYLDV